MSNPLIDFLELERSLKYHEELLEPMRKAVVAARRKAEQLPIPANARPATPADIKVGQVVWYSDFDEGAQTTWVRVDVVICPNSQQKAFVAEDGCRYGLDGALIADQTN